MPSYTEIIQDNRLQESVETINAARPSEVTVAQEQRQLQETATRSDIPPRHTSAVAKVVSHDAQDNIKGSVIQQHLQWRESMLQDWPETSV